VLALVHHEAVVAGGEGGVGAAGLIGGHEQGLAQRGVPGLGGWPVVAAREHGVDVDEAAAAVPELVDWWKLANRWHRPLVTGGQDPKAEARAVTAISKEFAARRAAPAGGTGETELAARLRGHIPAAMLMARKRDGTWVVLEPQPRSIDGEPGNVWAREHTWSKTLAAHRVREWTLPEPSQTARWRILWSSPAWAARDAAAAAAHQLTDPEIGDIITAALDAAARQAAAPYRPYRNTEPGEPLGGRAAAVTSRPSGDMTDHRFTVYWLCGRSAGDLEHGAAGAELTVRWRRTTGGKIIAEHGELRRHTWTSTPWEHRGHVVWRDGAAAAELDRALRAYHDAEQARRRIHREAASLCGAIAEQWSRDAREAARQKFIADYGDESLWADHSASMRFDCPHTGARGWEQPWERAVERLVRDGASLAGLTVADMARLHAGRFGDTVTAPGDIAHYRFPAEPD
jgi:hypothetical protein